MKGNLSVAKKVRNNNCKYSTQIYLYIISLNIYKTEKESLLEKSFTVLWNELWGKFSHTQYRQEEKTSHDKFTELKENIYIGRKVI